MMTITVRIIVATALKLLLFNIYFSSLEQGVVSVKLTHNLVGNQNQNKTDN